MTERPILLVLWDRVRIRWMMIKLDLLDAYLKLCNARRRG